MELMPVGDYYVWYCEWCDSRNLSLWTNMEKGTISCGACHHRFTMQGASYPVAVQALSQIL